MSHVERHQQVAGFKAGSWWWWWPRWWSLLSEVHWDLAWSLGSLRRRAIRVGPGDCIAIYIVKVSWMP